MKWPWTRGAEIDEEIRSHLQLAREDRIARGESPRDADRHARRELGNDLLVRERTRRMWAGVGFERWLKDLRHGARQLRRSPSFAGIAILTLALGLAAVTSAGAIIDSVLLAPLRYREPDRLFSLVNLPPPGTPNGYWLVNGRHFSEWRAHCRTCEDVAMAESIGFNLSGAGDAERYSGLRVSYNFFRTLGVQPALGRDFRPEEERPGDARVLILSHATWQTRFNADPTAVGRTVRVGGEPHVIVGVMPADFRLPIGRQWGPSFGPADVQPAMFRPLGQDFSEARPAGNNNYAAVVRLKADVTPARTIAELNDLIAGFVREFNIQPKPTLLPLQPTMVRDARDGLLLLFGIAVTTLLVVCVNVGNLMLVRTASRDREVSIRLALGSSPGQLVSLIVTEALLLVVVGTAASAVLASVALGAFSRWAPKTLPRLDEIHAGPLVWSVSLAAAAIATIVCGLVPAWRLARTAPEQSLTTSSLTHATSRQRARLRQLMVGIEVALTTVLLVIGGLFTVSFLRVLDVPTGVVVEHVLTLDVSTSTAGYTSADRARFIDDALLRLRELPGVVAAGITSQLPLRGEAWSCALRDAGPPERREIALANFRFVTPGYWDAAGIPVKQGRLLQETDRQRPVAILGESAARALWPGQDPIGRRVGSCSSESSLEVIGVVGDVRAELEKDAPIVVYQPYWSTPVSRPYFVIRTRDDPHGVAAEARATLRGLNPDFPVGRATSMQEIVDSSLDGRRFQMQVVVAFATFALLLALLGIYGVISFSVARRTPELGIRLALGARASTLGAMVVRQGMTPVLWGLAAGSVGALAAGRAISAELFGVAPNDPSIFAGVAVLLIGVGAVASWLPARRAMRTSALQALRSE